MRILYLFFVIILFFSPSYSFTQNLTFNFSNKSHIQKVEGNYFILEDPTNKKSFSDINGSLDFIPYNEKMLNLGITPSSYWIKLNIKNSTSSPIVLEVTQANLDLIEFYEIEENNISKPPIKLGETYTFYPRPYDHHNFIFDLNLQKDQTKTYYLKIKNGEPIIASFNIGTPKIILEDKIKKDLLFGVYWGIMIVMIIYNLFIYISVHDLSYLYYVLYISSVVLTHAIFQGYAYKFLWPSSPWISLRIIYIIGCFCGIATTLFTMNFIQTKKFTPFVHKILYLVIFLELIGMIAGVLDFFFISYKIMDLIALLGSLVILFAAIKISIIGLKLAKFFLIAFSISLGCVIIYVLMLKGIYIFPEKYINLVMPLGAAIETIMLSFALADRINILKKENEKKQLEVISALKENEKYLIAWREASISAEKFKKESISVQLESLKNQVNPHFLFNSLNVLVELLYKDQDQAARFVNELAHVYRYVLDHKSKELVELDCELKFIEAFIFLLQIRFDKSLKIKNNIPANTSIYIAPLTLQLLIENAIKHNVISEEDPLTIHLYMEKDFIIISNNIQLKTSPVSPSGIGLKNIQERYEFLTDNNIIIINDGKTFTVKIPIII